jgi:uncharacterized protein (DUF885 family)
MNRMTRLLPALLLSLLTCAGLAADPSPVTPSPRETAKAHRLFDEFWEDHLADNPGTATYLGDRRYDDRIFDVSEAAFKRRFRTARRFLARANAIDPALLADQDRISLEVLQWQLRLAVEGEPLHTYLEDNYLLPVNQMEGLHVRVLALPQTHPFETERDYLNYAARLRAVPRQVDAAIANMRKGMQLGVVLPRGVVERVLPQLDAGTVTDATTSVLYEPLARFPNAIDPKTRTKLTRTIERAIATAITPSFAKLQRFMRDEYLPKSRPGYSLADLPRGRELYDYAIRVRTSTSLSPDAIHALGLAKLEEIATERQQLVAQAGFQGTPVAFNQQLQANRELRWFDASLLERDIREQLARITPRLPSLFADLPVLDPTLRPVEAYREASFPAGAFIPGTVDGRRPPIYYYNTFNIASDGVRKFLVPNLSFHEVLPGHLLQFAYAQRNRALPPFRRFSGNAAYNEGWAAYAETLADEVDAYPDVAARSFYLSSQASLYVTMVAETGLHSKGWTRAQVAAFARQYLPMPDERLDLQIARWSIMPAQGVAYGLGALRIRQLRKEAELELGPRFDLRAFHEVVLSNGNVPLDVLTELVHAWMKSNSEAKSEGRIRK